MNRLTYRISEVAARLGVSQRTVERLVERGELEKVKVGRCTLVKAESVSKLLRERQEEPCCGKPSAWAVERMRRLRA